MNRFFIEGLMIAIGLIMGSSVFAQEPQNNTSQVICDDSGCHMHVDVYAKPETLHFLFNSKTHLIFEEIKSDGGTHAIHVIKKDFQDNIDATASFSVSDEDKKEGSKYGIPLIDGSLDLIFPPHGNCLSTSMHFSLKRLSSGVYGVYNIYSGRAYSYPNIDKTTDDALRVGTLSLVNDRPDLQLVQQSSNLSFDGLLSKIFAKAQRKGHPDDSAFTFEGCVYSPLPSSGS